MNVSSLGFLLATPRWRLRNDGETAWPIGSELAFVGNDKLGAPESVLVVTEDKPVPPKFVN